MNESRAILAPVERVVVETRRPTIDYETFVLRYGASQRLNALLIATSISAVVCALLVNNELYSSLLIVIAVATGVSGVLSLVTTLRAHNQYFERLAQVTVVERHAAIAGSEIHEDRGAREIVETPQGESLVATWRLTPEQRGRLAAHLRDANHEWRKHEIRALKVFPPRELDRWKEPKSNTAPEGVLSFYIRAGWVDPLTQRTTHYGREQLSIAARRAAAAHNIETSTAGRGVGGT